MRNKLPMLHVLKMLNVFLRLKDKSRWGLCTVTAHKGVLSLTAVVTQGSFIRYSPQTGTNALRWKTGLFLTKTWGLCLFLNNWWMVSPIFKLNCSVLGLNSFLALTGCPACPVCSCKFMFERWWSEAGRTGTKINFISLLSSIKCVFYFWCIKTQ